MTKAIIQTYELANEYRAKITLGLFGACILMIIFYILNVYGVISHTVALKGIEGRATVLSGEINRLDSRYLALSSAVTPDQLSAYGLSAGNVSAYIVRPASTASLGTLAAAVGHEL
jgi:hypothetical protein